MILRKIYDNYIVHYLDVFYNKYYPLTVLNRKKAKKRHNGMDFSLLTATCVGGYIYHQLGKQFMSPTISLNLFNSHFYKFITNLDYYLSLDFVPVVDKMYPHIPTGQLDDIVVHFTHYKSFEEGAALWNKRKARIDKDNLYIIGTDIAMSDEQIKALGGVKCKKMIIFTSKKYDYPWCMYIKEFEGLPHVGNYMGKTIKGEWRFERFFDYVEWLNSDDPVAQHFYIER